MEESKEEKSLIEDIQEKSEKAIKSVAEQGINDSNIDFLGKVIDIHKDIANEKYWKAKEEFYMYREDYGNYGRGRSRDSRGRYMEGMSYGRRGVPGSGRGRRYRGHDMIDDVYENYDMYSEGKEMADRGNYGAKEDTMKSLEYMMDSVVCFVEMLKEDASTQEEVDLIRKYARKISEI